MDMEFVDVVALIYIQYAHTHFPIAHCANNIIKVSYAMYKFRNQLKTHCRKT